MYDVLGSIPSISSLNYLFPRITFLYFRKTSIRLERFFPKWTIRQEQFWCQNFFGFALTSIRGDIAQWQSACFACMMSWVQSTGSPVEKFFAQGLRFFSEMDNQVGALVESRFFLVSMKMLCGDIAQWQSACFACMKSWVQSPVLTFSHIFIKTSIGLERFFPKWTIRQEQFWCQDFFGFALTRIRGDIAQWQSACFACMMSWVQSPVSPVVNFFAQGLRFFSEMDNQVGALVESRFFLVSHEKDVWGYSSVVERMLCMYEVLGSIPSISSRQFLCPSLTF